MLCKKIFLEAVTVCVGYSDFLREALSHNLVQLDSLTVVTTPDDEATRDLCRYTGVRCLPTECIYRDTQKPAFNKSRAINYGLAHMACSDWVLHLDADIVLPPQFRRMAENAELDPTCIYGMDRVDCVGYQEWDAFLLNPELQYRWSYLITPPRHWPIATRVTHGDYGGYLPIGYFQLWNPNASDVLRYPVKQDAAMEHSDTLHAIQWERRKRVLLPEGYCVHLSSQVPRFGENWYGRVSPPFRPVAGAPATAAPSADTGAAPARQAAAPESHPKGGQKASYAG